MLCAILSFAVSAETAAVAKIDPMTFLTTSIGGVTVQLTGTVRDIVDDDLDSHYHFIVLDVDRATIYCPIADVPRRKLTPMIGARVSVTGVQDPYNTTRGRRLLGKRLYVGSLDNITVLVPPPPDPFDTKRAADMRLANAAVDAHFLGRVKMVGRVLAAWDQRHFLLRRDDGLLAKVETIDDAPPHGAWVETVGSAESDLFNVNLLKAIWRPHAGGSASDETVTNITARAVLENKNGQREIAHDLYGQIIRIEGIVRSFLEKDGKVSVIMMENDEQLIPVRVSDVTGIIPETPVGSIISATGVCVFDIDNWYPNAPFPHVKGFFVVPRTAADVIVVSRPSWWTTQRLLAVIGALLAALIGFFVWNRALHAVIERRGRQLYREQIQSVKSELKFLERSNLAVELHDAISQYLTGIALELRTVDELAGGLSEGARRHLSVASRTLASCRDELRNCLWDLRHNTLDVTDLAEAIRMTVMPHVGTAQLTVRFDVARAKLAESVVHTLLQIVRELTANAVRHGNATEIKIAGKRVGNSLRFSVRDNGCGFAPDAVPGIEDGHFGLLGVRERTEKFEGAMEVESSPGHGTRITVSLTLKDEEP